MNRTLLYYPTIVIRNERWIRQSILYWDSIGSIVPCGMEDSLHESYDIEILQREGLFRIYSPNEYVQKKDDLLASEFMRVAEDNFISNRSSNQQAKPPVEVDLSWIYDYKMSYVVANWLERKSLAERKDRKLYMDSDLAMVYMSLLAKHMANDDLEAITTPSTDYPENLNLIYPKPIESRKMSVMNLSLHKVLPVPIENVQVADIIKFKAKRKDELTNFNRVISEYREKLKQLVEPVEIRELNASFVERIKIEVSNLGKAFHGDRMQFILGTIRNLFLVETSTLATALTTGLSSEIQFPLSVAGAVVAGGLSLGEYLMDVRNRQLERLAQNQYSYIYHATQEGIIVLP